MIPNSVFLFLIFSILISAPVPFIFGALSIVFNRILFNYLKKQDPEIIKKLDDYYWEGYSKKSIFITLPSSFVFSDHNEDDKIIRKYKRRIRLCYKIVLVAVILIILFIFLLLLLTRM